MDGIAEGLDNRLYKHSRLEEVSRLRDEFSEVYIGARRYVAGDQTVTPSLIQRQLDIALSRVDVLASDSYSSVITQQYPKSPLGEIAAATESYEKAIDSLRRDDPSSLRQLETLELHFAGAVSAFSDWAYASRRKMMGTAINADLSIIRQIREVQVEYFAIMLAFFLYIMVELILSLHSNRSLIRLVHDKKKAMRADYLTNISNRMSFEESLGLQPEAEPFGIVYFDLDGFKKINDTLGHNVGDKLLSRVANTLQVYARPGDIVSRFGGDEFAALVQGDKETVTKFALTIVRDISNGFEIDGKLVRTTSSAGVCHSTDQEPGMPVEDMLRKSDLALYRAKNTGKNSVQTFSVNLLAERDRRLRLERDIVDAIQNREIDVVFQPIISLATNRVAGVEALLRWRHPVYGDVNPLEVCEIAQQVGQILPLTALVLEAACRLRVNIGFAGANFYVAVNISPDVLGNRDFAHQVEETVQHWSVDPENVVLEITEQSLDADVGEATSNNLQVLRGAGFPLAVDDFGSGQSNLARLSKADFRVLKLDRSLVENIDSSYKEAQIVAAISRLAVEIGMKTVAEGVETLDQVRLLREFGISSIQGYIAARPMSAIETLRFLVENADGVHSLHEPATRLEAERA
jgi:diguanylate cyclase (GGDEF)-like protein